MNKKRMLVWGNLLLFFKPVFAHIEKIPSIIQEKPGPYARPYGYLRGAAYADTRQVFGSHDNYTAYLPMPQLMSTDKDPDGNPMQPQDCYKHGQLGASFTETYLGFKFGGYSLGSWAANGVVEGDFYGASPYGTVLDYHEHPLTFRMRLAFVKLVDRGRSALVGYFFHPLCLEECYPHTVSYTTGVPFDIQARCPQFRFSFECNKIRIISTAFVQQFYASSGPEGFQSKYMHWNAAPGLDLQAHFLCGKLLVGGGIDIKAIVPRLAADFIKDEKKYYVVENERVVTGIGELFGAYTGEKLEWRAKWFLGYNTADFSSIGGYAVSTVNSLGQHTYTPFGVTGLWFDMDWNITKEWKIGLFAGAIKHLKTLCSLYIDPATNQPIVYDIGYNYLNKTQVKNTARIAPRIVWKHGPFEFGGEVEACEATYGPYNVDRTDEAQLTSDGTIEAEQTVTNVRFLALVGYEF